MSKVSRRSSLLSSHYKSYNYDDYAHHNDDYDPDDDHEVTSSNASGSPPPRSVVTSSFATTTNTNYIKPSPSSAPSPSPSPSPSSLTTPEQIKSAIQTMEHQMSLALQQFHINRASLLQQLNAAQSSTRHFLPYPEILGYIFLLVCERESYQGQRMAHRLAGVCREWREVAKSVKMLWSLLILFFGKRKGVEGQGQGQGEREVEEVCEKRANLLKVHLDRVSDTPFSLTFLFDTNAPRFTGGGGGGDDLTKTFGLFWELLNKGDNAHKVHTLRLVRAPFDWIRAFPALPSLGYLGIYDEQQQQQPQSRGLGGSSSGSSERSFAASRFSGRAREEERQLPLLNSPRLYRLEIRGLHRLQPFQPSSVLNVGESIEQTTTMAKLTWLTHISVSCIPIDVGTSLLLCCPNLVQFEASDPKPPTGFTSNVSINAGTVTFPSASLRSPAASVASNERIVLRHLTHFGWAHTDCRTLGAGGGGDEGEEYIRNVYRRLRFPSLRSFYWWSNHHHPQVQPQAAATLDNEAFNYLLPNFPSSLYLFKIHAATQWSVDLIRNICAALPTVQVLILYGCDYTTMIGFLTILGGSGGQGLGSLGLGDSPTRRRSSGGGGGASRAREIYLPKLKRLSMDGIDSTSTVVSREGGLEDQLAERVVEAMRFRCRDNPLSFSLEVSKREGTGMGQWSRSIWNAYQLMRDEGIDFKVWLDARKTRLLGRNSSR